MSSGIGATLLDKPAVAPFSQLVSRYLVTIAVVFMRNAAKVLSLILLAAIGCSSGPDYVYAPDCPAGQFTMPEQAMLSYSNPIFIPVADSHSAWETVVDVVDDYFRIDREEPVRMVGDMLTEGSITTAAEISPTIFEPWRYDTADPEQRIENTLQTMRRRAVVRVIPAQGGHWVDVAVFKELEDLPRPELATAGAATFRYDSTLSGIENPQYAGQAANGWIAKGRDASMEQYMIAHLLNRCGQTGGASAGANCTR